MRPNFDWSPDLSNDQPGDLPTADTVRIDAEAEELMGPSSRPTLNDTPRARSPIAELDEDENAFFQAGDDGRYEGGPATLEPVVLDDVEADEVMALPPPDPRVLARRARGARVVALIVGAMASIFAVGLVRSSSSAQQPDDTVTPPAPIVAAPAPVKIAPPASRTPPKRDKPEPEPEPEPVAEAPAAKKAPRAYVPAAAPIVEEPSPAPLPPPPVVPQGPPPTAAFPPAS
jgi:hypothetical protein